MTGLVLGGSALFVVGLVLACWGYRAPRRAEPARVRSVSVMSILARCAVEASAQSVGRPVLAGRLTVGVES
ncbi:hypothetical protein FHR81_002730 [Actinoalloteichus hoggarensis]|uniref:Uncharacterized protein n=1 Tax=Actinoalloteichus hoggarensis TaxID=1470176 RepID=A0A221VXY2_9PSEU|nr:hypothetical protein [Actinoalloteichus hoggarensis]ASO18327.1 hypothetical protein AHOG_03345 [Actinoalloteichus hoggarensis]MBB5921690.1 hypothetical protein [Actinoalloteichus hoggarensis]